jgi:hypothetical protein
MFSRRKSSMVMPFSISFHPIGAEMVATSNSLASPVLIRTSTAIWRGGLLCHLYEKTFS